MFGRRPLLKKYMSDIGCFLKKLEHTHTAPSAARAAEEAKHARIKRLRDDPNATEQSDVWGQE